MYHRPCMNTASCSGPSWRVTYDNAGNQYVLVSTGRCTVPNVIIVAKIINYLRKTVITTVITAVTQCGNVVTNRNYDRDEDTFATIITFGTVCGLCICLLTPAVPQRSMHQIKCSSEPSWGCATRSCSVTVRLLQHFRSRTILYTVRL